MEKHPPAYLSPSRLSCYDWCPAEFYKRYVLKQSDPPTADMLFGTAVHKGLEASFCGEDDELAFLREWRTAKQALTEAHTPFDSWLDQRGLELLDQVRNLALTGLPERWLSVLHPDVPIPIIGYADLWDEATNTIYDFKTTGFVWTQQKADAQVFQPAVYSQAFIDAFDTIPRFTFVVLTRSPGPVKLLDGTRTGQQIYAAFERAKEIHEAIEAKQFDCRCGRHQEAAA